MVHGGVPFQSLKVGQTFRFPAQPKPGQHRSPLLVKLNARAYATVVNQAAPGHPWNTYVHEVGTVAVHVDPEEMLSASRLAMVLRAVDETRRQDRAASGVAASAGGGARLTYQEKKAAPKSAFALPEKRAFYIGDATHAANAMARLSMSWNMGHLTEAEYQRAHAAIRKAEAHFGVHHHAGHGGARKIVRREIHAAHAEAGGGANMVPDAGYFAATHSGWDSFSSGVGGGGSRPSRSRARSRRAGGGAVVAVATGKAGGVAGDLAEKLLNLASRRGATEEVVELVHEGLRRLYRGDVDAARRYLRNAERARQAS